MRASFFAALVAVPCMACGAGAGLHASNSAKMGEALAFAAVAGAAQMVQAAAEQHARNSAPVRHASTGLGVSPGCDNDSQYGCMTATVVPSDGVPPAPEAEMDDEGARDYVLGYVNGVRKLNAAVALGRDESLDAFAQAGSDELSQDHLPGRHFTAHIAALPAGSVELQGSPEGAPPGSLQDRIAEILLRWTAEGPGGMHHDAMLRSDWHKVGVGIAHREGRMYFTVDFSS
jgi:uncharacterized protein YkwD